MYCQAIREYRQEVLAEMLTKEQAQFMKTMRNDPSVIRTSYVCALLVERNAAKVEATKKLFEKVAKTHPYPSDIQSDRELMEIAERIAQGLPV